MTIFLSSPLICLVPTAGLSLLVPFLCGYLHSNSYDVGNTFPTKFISEASRSMTITYDMFSWSFNVVWHTSKPHVKLSFFSISNDTNSTAKFISVEVTPTISKSGSLCLLFLYVESIMRTGKNVEQLDGIKISPKYTSNNFFILTNSVPRYIMIVIQKI